MSPPVRRATVAAALAALASTVASAQMRLSPIRQGTSGPAAAPTAPQATLGNVRSKDGTSIAFERSGAGEVVILVSGALSTRAGNARLAALLAPHLTVINYDRRGRGQSGDTQPYAVDREIEDIEALIDHAGGSAFLFGSSSGAALALEATGKLPAKVTKAALFEPPFIVDESRPPVPADFVAHVNELVSADRRGDAVEYFMTQAVGVPTEAVARMRQSPMWPGMERTAHTLAYDGAIMGVTQAGKPLPAGRWASATVPALVIEGEMSAQWLRNAAQALAAALPNARLRTLQGQDHSVVFRAPQAIAPVLVEFFRPGQEPLASDKTPSAPREDPSND